MPISVHRQARRGINFNSTRDTRLRGPLQNGAGLGLALALGIFSAVHPSAAEEEAPRFITLDIRQGELTPRIREILSELIEPRQIEEIFVKGLVRAKPVSEICKHEKDPADCGRDAEGLRSQVGRPSDGLGAVAGNHAGLDVIVEPSANYTGGQAYTPDFDWLSGQGWGPRIYKKGAAYMAAGPDAAYVLVAADDPRVVAYKPVAGSGASSANLWSGTLVVPLLSDTFNAAAPRAMDDRKYGTLGERDVGILPVDTRPEAELALLESDLVRDGTSHRQFRLNPSLPPEEVRRRVAMLTEATGPQVSTEDDETQVYSLTAPPESSMDPATLQAVTQKCLADARPDWPFDAREVVDRLKFALDVLAKENVGGPQRTKVLIVDTGISPTLLERPEFRGLLYPNLQERLAKHAAFTSLSSYQQHSRSGCRDLDGNSFYADHFGAAPKDEAGKCWQDGFGTSQLTPVPKNASSRQSYFPDHGSFVAGLAAGGPGLDSERELISKFVGLTFFRVFVQPKDPLKNSVGSDYKHLEESLSYAERSGADVINMSLATTDRRLLNGLLPLMNNESDKRILAVVAAGNNSEALDASDPNSVNIPASASKENKIRPNMIVVGALQQATSVSQDPLWPNSATSKVKVDIAAPGVRMVSLNSFGQNICMSGTSAAAPLVTFTAAILRSIGLTSPTDMRARILSAADFDSKLADRVAHGRRLNIAAAIDVFVDRIVVGGATRRGWINTEDTGPQLLRVCATNNNPFVNPTTLDGFGGLININNLWLWRQLPNERVQVWHRQDDFNFEECALPDTTLSDVTLSFFDLASNKTEEIALKNVESILPSPFRNVEQTVKRIGARN